MLQNRHVTHHHLALTNSHKTKATNVLNPCHNPVVTERYLAAGAAPLNKTWLRWTGKDQWPKTTATVYSCDFSTRQERDSPVGHYHVVISYTVAGEIYTGRFVDFGLQSEEDFHRGDTLEIRYNPKNPSKFYYPDLRTQTGFHLMCVAIGGALATIVMLIRFLSG
ncbi:MAG TPA: DUF3592 domain-containing protein [Candidatus Sulfotelmatobacter sp.]|nr:DUF3592 domain-containing protein [Candidatus Sulfotelmatobacter sp.]